MGCMTLYLLDFRGTLDTLPSPVDYIGALREKHPEGCMIIVVSGTEVPRHVKSAADEVWSKDGHFISPLKQLYKDGYREAVFCDDKPIIMRAYNRTLRKIGFSVTAVHPDDLITLIPTFSEPKGG